MHRKDIIEGPFQRGVARGFNATQKGGAIGPDAAERWIKDFFTKPGEKPKKDTSTKTVTKKVEPPKGSGGTPPKATAPEPKAAEPKVAAPEPKVAAPEPKAEPKKDDFPTGVAGGKYIKVKPGDAVIYTNAKGMTKDGEVTKLLDTRDKQGDLQIQLKKKNAVFAVDRQNITQVNGQDWKYKPDTDTGKTKEEKMTKAVKEGLADLAGRAEADHEVQMARADLYKIAKYAIKLHDMLKGVSEERGLEGWQQAKITKAADYIGSVYHNLEYDMKFGDQSDEIGPDKEMQMGESKDTHCSDKCCGSDVKAEDCTCPPTCKHCNCNAVKEGKSPHKKGSTKYKKHMAAMHAGMKEDAYKSSIAEKLAKKLEASVTPPSKPADIKAKDVKAKKLKPDSGGHPTGS